MIIAIKHPHSEGGRGCRIIINQSNSVIVKTNQLLSMDNIPLQFDWSI